MARYQCRTCEAYSFESGCCVVCRKSLGSHYKALSAAACATVAMGILWMIFSVALRIQMPLVAGIFGGVVAACTSRFSGGRGISYQAIATVFTILGIIVFDSLAMIALAVIDNQVGFAELTWGDVWRDIKHHSLYDPFTACFYGVGILTSLIIWR